MYTCAGQTHHLPCFLCISGCAAGTGSMPILGLWDAIVNCCPIYHLHLLTVLTTRFHSMTVVRPCCLPRCRVMNLRALSRNKTSVLTYWQARPEFARQDAPISFTFRLDGDSRPLHFRGRWCY